MTASGERASITFIAHAMTVAQHEARFPRSTDALSPTGLRQCRRATHVTPARLSLSPALAARQTAEALGWAGGDEEPLAREQDYGAWAGARLDQVDPADLECWRRAGEVPRGESLRDLLVRVSRLIDAAPGGRSVVITHQSVLRCAIVVALGCEPDAFWDIDAEPLSSVVVRRSESGRYRLRLDDAR